ncbi:Pyruvate phosphate dikinase, PEP/pyruvate binding domain [uncultured archaeon]|nr:Pyruvate phosphate dikinase, PEP/pyruvate binding domain [uncultured archaeon]
MSPSSTGIRPPKLKEGVQCAVQPKLFFLGKNGAAQRSQAGGKYRRILSFNNLIIENQHLFDDKNVKIILPAVSCIQTDCFEKFVDSKGQNLRVEAAMAENDGQIISKFLQKDFSKSQMAELAAAHSRHSGPLVLRASTLWEDANHVSVNDVFASIFLPNNSDEKTNFTNFTLALKRMYANAFSSQARAQAQAQGLMPSTIQMAVVIQDVPGMQTGIVGGHSYLYPAYSFYANSFNDYAYNGLNPSDGYVKYVFGLGTGIKTEAMNHALRVNLGAHPTFSGLKSDEKMFNQRPQFAYALSLDRQPRLEGDGNGNLVALPIENMSEGIKRRHLCYYNTETQQLENNVYFGSRAIRHEAMLFKNDDIRDKPGSLTRAINSLLALLKGAYGSEVGFEGSADFADGPDGPNLLVYPLDAHLQPKAWDDRLQSLPSISGDRIIFGGGNSIGRGRYKINKLVEVLPNVPTYRFGYDIATELASINKELKASGEDGRYMLFAHGRIGTHSKGEGIPVSFVAIDHAAVLAERISGESMPSQGGHFLQDVVAHSVACTSYVDANALTLSNLGDNVASVQQLEYTRVYHLKQPLEFVIDAQKNSMLYMP